MEIEQEIILGQQVSVLDSVLGVILGLRSRRRFVYVFQLGFQGWNSSRASETKIHRLTVKLCVPSQQ